MLEFSDETDFDSVGLRPFVRRPQAVAATIVDQPFTVSNGEYYRCGFAAGDYLVLTDHGPIGMKAETFVKKYRPLSRTILGSFEACIGDDGVITLEPCQ